MTFLVKRYEFSNRKETYFESYKNEHYVEYIKQLINVLNTMVFSVKNNEEVLFMNNLAMKSMNADKNEVRVGTRENLLAIPKILVEENKLIDYNIHVNSFFNSLTLISPLEREFNQLEKGKTFFEIIAEIFSDQNFNSRNFSRVGYFSNLAEEKFFDIYVRKLKFKEEVLEILINDITELKIAEKNLFLN